MVHEIQGLQAMHNAIEDEDEKRALGEDITGKILWICWCGICSEVERLLPKVIEYILKGREVLIIEGMRIDPDDNHRHLWRIMLDAGAGISKHRLLLATRASTPLRDQRTLDTLEILPSTSYETPYTSMT
ncbi:hypothetical protein F5J12DRAFT_339259 [Pisolithus orientalis]|uniref:uncharacterized protein n=1 Tax=Pisolithus orientalis TaxID=936130 RepID=UPI0022250F75|nr:uncharacterized protein F5J12DRAFT_339259 [Pisolithus orientalis]KAI5997229.1 hypothetical protein F5J12DRAFT_339259 [Pisolithus orientalis]